MYVERLPNRNARPVILLREAWREGGKIRKRTIANLTHWPEHVVEQFRQILRGERLVPADQVLTIETSLPHGHVHAVLGTIRKLGLERVLSARPCRERDLVVAMIAERLLHPASKLATTRLWHTTTLAQEVGVGDADVHELYDALDWLRARQPRIEKKLASRHLTEGGQVLYDVSSSFYEGHTCVLAQFGHNRDGKRGLRIIVYGVLTDAEGRPVAVDVYRGNTGDPSTVPDQVEKLRTRFGITRVVLVGDRGMLTQARIEALKEHPGLGWISALRSQAIRALVDAGHLQMSLFDQKALAEISSPEYPGERLVACFNPLLAQERRRKREELLEATERELTRLAKDVARRRKTPLAKAEIGMRAGKVLNRFKVGKHYALTIEDGRFEWRRRPEVKARETALDGIYVIRTSEATEQLSAPDVVRSYKGLAVVERAFRCLKGMELRIRPIRHRTEDHVRAHIFLCMLAYYVEWHMRRSLAPVLFDDEQIGADRARPDPVSPAKASASARKKKAVGTTPDGLPVHSFETLLQALATQCRVTCRVGAQDSTTVFQKLATPTPIQQRAFTLLGLYPVTAH